MLPPWDPESLSSVVPFVVGTVGARRTALSIGAHRAGLPIGALPPVTDVRG